MYMQKDSGVSPLLALLLRELHELQLIELPDLLSQCLQPLPLSSLSSLCLRLGTKIAGTKIARVSESVANELVQVQLATW